MPTTTPDVSVIVPTRNRAQLLERLLHQLVRLEGPLRYELIVVDEGSSDETPALLDRFADAHGLHVVRHDTPRGLPAARNAGFQCSTGRYVAWIDDDDLTSTDRIWRQHDGMQASGLRWSCAARVDIDDDLRVVGWFPCPRVDNLLPALLRMNVLPSTAQGLLVARSLAEEVGPYDEALRSAEDWEYCIRLTERSRPHLLDEPLVAYRTGAPSMSTNTDRMRDALRTVVERHAPLYASEGVTPDWAAMYDSLLSGALLSGRRPAVTCATHAWRAAPTLRRTARVGAAALSPRWFARHSAGRREAQVPPAWRQSAARWLADVQWPAISPGAGPTAR